MRQGDTLGDDQFSGYKFDYIISNPPFGIEWKPSRQKVEEEFKLGGAGRFEPGLPSIGDGQMLFLLNGVAKLKDEGRMAIIQNGSSLFKGDAGSGESNIRGYLLDHDWLEAIVQLPTDLFYNTGIATYVWVVTKNKSAERQGKVQLIDASQCSEKRRKPLGNKRVEQRGAHGPFHPKFINLVQGVDRSLVCGVHAHVAVGIGAQGLLYVVDLVLQLYKSCDLGLAGFELRAQRAQKLPELCQIVIEFL